MHLIHRKTCRVCGSAELTKVIDLGDQHLQGAFVKPGNEMPPMRKIPTALYRCDPTRDERACGLLQMGNSVPPEVLYSSYWYRSGTNNTMRTHLQGIADQATQLLNRSSACVLDIGCNDGTLLSHYPKEYKKYGVDPSNVAQEINGDVIVVQDIFPSNELLTKLKGDKCDIVTSIAMFYDLENPVEFTKQVKKILALDGIWIFEMSYMPAMLNMNSYDTICHEHLEYYSLSIIEYIMKVSQMKILNVELNDINGGSLRCYAVHADNSKYGNDEYVQNIKKMRRDEFDMELDTDKPYKNFQDRINLHRKELRALLNKLKKQGRKIHIYGASTKGNTILQWCGIDQTIIDYAAERSPEKCGAKTLGTNVPIISEAESRAMNPDYYLVLPWHFKKEFIAREKEMLAQGVGFIFPLPTIEVIRNENR